MRAFCVKIFGFEFKTSDGYLDTVLAVTSQHWTFQEKNSIQIGRSLCKQIGNSL